VRGTGGTDVEGCPPALQVKMEGKNAITGHDEVYIITCPWKSATKFLGIISFILCQIFAIFVCCKAKGKGSVGILGGISFIVMLLLLITMIMMIVDITKGKKDYAEVESDKTSYQPLTYILNVLLTAAGLVFGIICTVIGCKSVPNMTRGSGHQPTQNGNNSTFVGINKSIGMERSFQTSGNTYGNDNSFAATQTWNNGYYAGNMHNNTMNTQGHNRVTPGGGNLTYQTNNVQPQNMGYNSNHRGHVNMGQQNNYAGHAGNAGNVNVEGRRDRINRRGNPGAVQNNNNYGNSSPQRFHHQG